jgi:hypothetical protein
MPSWSGTPHSLGVSHIILRERELHDYGPRRCCVQSFFQGGPSGAAGQVLNPRANPAGAMRAGARSPAVAPESRPDHRRATADQRESVLAGRAGLRDDRFGATLRYVRGLSASRQTSRTAITPRQRDDI